MLVPPVYIRDLSEGLQAKEVVMSVETGLTEQNNFLRSQFDVYNYRLIAWKIFMIASLVIAICIAVEYVFTITLYLVVGVSTHDSEHYSAF